MVSLVPEPQAYDHLRGKRTGERRAQLEVTAAHHYGPDPAYVGGIGSVIRVLGENAIGAASVLAHPTWRPHARLASLPLALASALGVPRITRSEVVHVHLAENGSFIREGGLLVFAGLLGKRTVATIHGADFLPFARKHPRLARLVLRRARVITCLEPAVAELLGELAPRSTVELLANPVAMDEASPRASSTEEIVLFAGEIGRRKGADVLCDAWRQVSRARPQARCLLVGPVREFSVTASERLEVREPVDASEMRELIRRARVIALPSRSEGMPMILTEAMSAGRPFVSTPVGGIEDLAREGGILTAVGDASMLAAELIALLADPELADAIGEGGRRHCRETRSVPVIDAQLRRLYQGTAPTARP